MKHRYNVFASIYITLHLLVYNAKCSNILVLSFIPCKSHIFWDGTLAEGLKNEGHNVTILQQFPGKNVNNYTVLEVKGNQNFITATPEELFGLLFLDMFSHQLHICEHVLNSPEFRILLKQARSGFKYDLIILGLVGGPCLYPLIKLFGLPLVVGTSTFGVVPYVARSFGVNNNEYYVPFYTEQYSTHMNFFQRIYNYFIHSYEYFWKSYYWSQYNKLHKKYFATEIDDLIQFEKNFSLLLANYDPVLDLPRSLPPNVIPVGGLHIKKPKPLDKDLQTYLDESKHGVIVLSLGTLIRLEVMQNCTFNILLKAFSKLKQNVIIKYNSNIKIHLPHNVKTMKYLPQIDILAHHNVKLIINHGGALSTHEAISMGIPLISIPFLLDQHSRVANIVEKKVGKKLSINSLTEGEVLSTIQEVLENPIYKINSQKLSKIFRDKPLTPLQTAVFWTQHVMRNGDTHLRNPESDLPLYVRYFLDLWICIALFIYLFIQIVFYVIRTSELKLNKNKME